jgi:hypothetical protein
MLGTWTHNYFSVMNRYAWQPSFIHPTPLVQDPDAIGITNSKSAMREAGFRAGSGGGVRNRQIISKIEFVATHYFSLPAVSGSAWSLSRRRLRRECRRSLGCWHLHWDVQDQGDRKKAMERHQEDRK